MYSKVAGIAVYGTGCFRSVIMKIVAMICNVVLFGFTGLVLACDGPPRGVAYIVFTLLALLMPVFSAVVIFRMGSSEGWLGPREERAVPGGQGKMEGQAPGSTLTRAAAMVGNIVLIGFTWWAILDQYPHPEEDGVIAFAVLMVLTPILTLVVLLRGGTGTGLLGLDLKGKPWRLTAKKRALKMAVRP
jgi:hypothetical protein